MGVQSMRAKLGRTPLFDHSLEGVVYTSQAYSCIYEWIDEDTKNKLKTELLGSSDYRQLFLRPIFIMIAVFVPLGYLSINYSAKEIKQVG